MALPDAENLAYRGITSGDAQCIAYRGYVCGYVVQKWRDTIEFTMVIARQINKIVRI